MASNWRELLPHYVAMFLFYVVGIVLAYGLTGKSNFWISIGIGGRRARLPAVGASNGARARLVEPMRSPTSRASVPGRCRRAAVEGTEFLGERSVATSVSAMTSSEVDHENP